MNVGWQRAINGLRGAGIRVLVFASLAAPAAGRAADAPPMTSFVKASGTAFTVDGKPFFVTGVNSHYLTFGSKDEVIRVLDGGGHSESGAAQSVDRPWPADIHRSI